MPFLLVPFLVVALVAGIGILRRLFAPTVWVVSSRGRLCSREEAEIEEAHY